MIQFELPFPVPLRALWKVHKGGGGVPTDRYKSYGREAWGMIAHQRPKKFKGPVSIDIVFVAPDKRPRDGDNLLKCLFDTLKTNGVIEDDNKDIVRRFSVSWAEAGPPCLVQIQPFPTAKDTAA